MFCKNCGTQLKDGSAFCHSCGTAVTAPKTQATEVENPASAVNSAEETLAQVTFDAPEVNATESTQPIYQMPQYTVPVDEPQDNKKGFSIASLILGIVSFLPCCCVNFITAILAVVFGIIGIKSSNKTLSIVGIILAAVAFILYIIVIVLYMFILETNTEDFTYFFGDNMYY